MKFIQFISKLSKKKLIRFSEMKVLDAGMQGGTDAVMPIGFQAALVPLSTGFVWFHFQNTGSPRLKAIHSASGCILNFALMSPDWNEK